MSNYLQVEKYARKALASKEKIVLTNRLMRNLGYNSTRDFFHEMGTWGYNTNFGELSSRADDDIQTYLRAFIRSFVE